MHFELNYSILSALFLLGKEMFFGQYLPVNIRDDGTKPQNN